MPIFKRIEWWSARWSWSSVTRDTPTPSTRQPLSEIVQVVSLPYCDPSSFHQRGVNLPRRSPKSPGEIHVPIRASLTQRLISEGQSALVPGASDDISRLNSIASISAPAILALLGNLYST